MKINQAYVYLVNQYDVKLDIFLFNEKNKSYEDDELKNKDDNIITYSSLNRNTSSYRSRVLYTLTHTDLFNLKVDRIISVKDNVLYMYVKCNIDEKKTNELLKNLSNNFKAVEAKEEITYIEKLYDKFNIRIAKQKRRFRIKAAFLTANDIILLSFAALLIIVQNIASAIFDTEFSFKKTMITVAVSIFVLFITKICSWIYNINHLYKEFLCTYRIDLEDDEKLKIRNLINDNIAKQPFYKKFRMEEFSPKNPSKDYKKNAGEAFLINDDQNVKLNENAKKMDFKLEKYYREKNDNTKRIFASIYSEKVKEKQVIFDSNLIGLDTDLIFFENQTIAIKKIKYHDYICNDDMIYKNLSSASNPSYFLKGLDLTLDQTYSTFRNIKKSSLANTIGINLIVELVVGEKKYYIVNKQCTSSNVNNEKYVPSASGSLDYSDYKKNKGKTFYDLLKYGMLRELYEESYIESHYFYDNIKKLEIINEETPFEILGVARLFSKAGKPDFFGKITINIKEEDINRILDNYNDAQNYFLSNMKEKSHLESTHMHIIEESEFLKKAKDNDYEESDSIQLRYTKYLINYYNNINKK